MYQASSKPRSPSMAVHVFRAYIHLLQFDLLLARRGFPAVHEQVRKSCVRQQSRTLDAAERICHAFDLACVLYFKQVRCLQRSAATAVLLRRAGFSAQLVIGVQPCPFRAHAWVELDGCVVNDKSYVASMYQVLERC